MIQKLIYHTLILFVILSISCTHDPCLLQEEICLNGGVCESGICNCPDGFTGTNCAEFVFEEIQSILDSRNYTPLEIIDKGAAVEQLYGKNYMGGIIFFIDVENLHSNINGLIAAPSDHFEKLAWGCELLDIEELENISSNQDTIKGARIGDGIINTQVILSNCEDINIAARICSNYGENWYLPSRGELDLLYKNLYLNNLGNFSPNSYWSSTEADYSNPGVVAWVHNFSEDWRNIDGKNNKNLVRPVNSF